MKVCEVCGGVGHNGYKLLCDACHGTGLICLGYEGEAHHEALRAEARARASREGWTERVWQGEQGTGSWVRVPVTLDRKAVA